MDLDEIELRYSKSLSISDKIQKEEYLIKNLKEMLEVTNLNSTYREIIEDVIKLLED